MPLQVLLILNTLPCCAVTKTHERNVVIQISHFTPRSHPDSDLELVSVAVGAEELVAGHCSAHECRHDHLAAAFGQQ